MSTQVPNKIQHHLIKYYHVQKKRYEGETKDIENQKKSVNKKL